MTIELRSGVASDRLRTIARKLLHHHDALRLRFDQQARAGGRFVSSRTMPDPLQIIDLSHVPRVERDARIATVVSELHHSLDLTRGPLVRFALVDPAESSGPACLYIVIHHLVVDSVSWRILLDDLISSYEQLESGREIALPAKTTSFKEWAEHVAVYAGSERARAELAYWVSQPWHSAVRLPRDHDGDAASNTVDVADIVSVSFSEAETEALLMELPRTHGVDVQAALVAALLRALWGLTWRRAHCPGPRSLWSRRGRDRRRRSDPHGGLVHNAVSCPAINRV